MLCLLGGRNPAVVDHCLNNSRRRDVMDVAERLDGDRGHGVASAMSGLIIGCRDPAHRHRHAACIATLARGFMWVRLGTSSGSDCPWHFDPTSLFRHDVGQAIPIAPIFDAVYVLSSCLSINRPNVIASRNLDACQIATDHGHRRSHPVVQSRVHEPDALGRLAGDDDIEGLDAGVSIKDAMPSACPRRNEPSWRGRPSGARHMLSRERQRPRRR